MPTLLITTPGASDANSWASLDEAKAYAAIRTPQVGWFTAVGVTDTLIEQRLIYACLLICSSFNWNDSPTYPDQALALPRKGLKNRNGVLIPDTEITIDAKNAQSEMMLQLGLKDQTKENVADKLGVLGIKAGSVGIDLQQKDLSTYEAMDADTIRRGAEFNYFSVPDIVRRLLVPSWYKEAEGRRRRAMVFKGLGGLSRRVGSTRGEGW